MDSTNTFRFDWRIGVLLTFVFGTLIAMFSMSPISQDLSYHSFADQRSLLGIPHGLDVLSNIPFLLAGLFGVWLVSRPRFHSLPKGWLVLFVGISFVSFGSSFYHWMPNNDSLVWDRLPMTIGFMGLFVALIGEYVDEGIARKILIPALALGVFSVGYWHFTDDLRLYAWVQIMSLSVIVVFLSIYKSRFTHSWVLLLALGLYVLAKVTESYDAAIFDLVQGAISGHSIKHLLAATGCFAIVQYLGKRRPK